MGRYYFLNKEYKKAIEYFEKAMSLSPDNRFGMNTLNRTRTSYNISQLIKAYEEKGLDEMRNFFSKLKTESPQIADENMLNWLDYEMISNKKLIVL